MACNSRKRTNRTTHFGHSEKRIKRRYPTKSPIVILDMDTPGGELGVTLEIMEEIIENLEKFDGKIITYVNDEAISAGAYIAIATSEIAFR